MDRHDEAELRALLGRLADAGLLDLEPRA
jgi:hypothetical protein